jgi:hypothetical protein
MVLALVSKALKKVLNNHFIAVIRKDFKSLEMINVVSPQFNSVLTK